MSRRSDLTVLLSEARLSRPADRRDVDVVAAELGVHPRTYTKWEAGDYIPPGYHWPAIAKQLDLDVGDLADAVAKRERSFARQRRAVMAKLDGTGTAATVTVVFALLLFGVLVVCCSLGVTDVELLHDAVGC